METASAHIVSAWHIGFANEGLRPVFSASPPSFASALSLSSKIAFRQYPTEFRANFPNDLNGFPQIVSTESYFGLQQGGNSIPKHRCEREVRLQTASLLRRLAAGVKSISQTAASFR